MKILNIVLASWLLLLALVSCDKDSNEISPIVEVKEESISGTWELSREDNGIFITTSFTLNDDNTCVYTQTISSNMYYEDIEDCDYKIELNGKWSLDKKSATLTFDLKDIEGNGTVTLQASVTGVASTGSAAAFKIIDEYSDDDNYSFKNY